jgi:hypothetical protein
VTSDRQNRENTQRAKKLRKYQATRDKYQETDPKAQAAKSQNNFKQPTHPDHG